MPDRPRAPGDEHRLPRGVADRIQLIATAYSAFIRSNRLFDGLEDR